MWKHAVPTERRRAAARSRFARCGAAILLAALTGCTPEPPKDELTVTPVRFSDLPGWSGDRHAEALPALAKSCAVLSRRPADAMVGHGPAARRAGDWAASCAGLRAVPPGDDRAARAYLERAFAPYRIAKGGKSDGLFTGYFEPELHGSLRRGGRFTVPLYARPDNLITVDLGKFRDDLQGERIVGRVVRGSLVPYHSRADIDSGALDGNGRVLAWVDDPADAFFLHIQGSGRVILPDGSVLRIGYAAKNGLQYHSIGRYLVSQGAFPLEKASMQTIKAWLRGHPAQARAVMAQNPSYIFFRRLNGTAPVGAQGVELTPERSLAVDPRFVPLGAPLWLDTTYPLSDQPMRRLFVAQDIGGAIKGPIRGDVFWGHGDRAASNAGRMKQKGTYYLLLPRPAGNRPTS